LVSKRVWYVICGLVGLAGCCVIAQLGLSPIAFIPPGALALFGFGSLAVTAGETDDN
jgi:hypothetical protein